MGNHTNKSFFFKSATLILQTFWKKPYMIAVDRHLLRSFTKLEWIHNNTTDFIEIAIQVSKWLPSSEYININNIITGLNQLL